MARKLGQVLWPVTLLCLLLWWQPDIVDWQGGTRQSAEPAIMGPASGRMCSGPPAVKLSYMDLPEMAVVTLGRPEGLAMNDTADSLPAIPACLNLPQSKGAHRTGTVTVALHFQRVDSRH